MNKIICASDTHLKPWNIRSFVDHVKSTGASGLLLTGDITEGFNFESAIEFLALNLTMPIYFVLGNHDFWGSSTAERYWQTRKLCEKYPNLMWLTESEPVRINKNSCLIGSEGWHCGSFGNSNYLKYTLDQLMMFDFRDLNFNQKLVAYTDLAKKSCVDIEEKLQSCVGEFKKIYIATHFPPFTQIERNISELLKPLLDPYNYNVMLGNLIKEYASNYPKIKFKVYSGHIHSSYSARIGDNLKCKVIKNFHDIKRFSKIII